MNSVFNVVLTMFLWSELVTSNLSMICSKLSSIVWCFAMSVARMHLKNAQCPNWGGTMQEVRRGGSHAITVRRNRWNCSWLRFLTMLHWGFWRMWNATEQWWFSSGDASLYRKARAVPAFTCHKNLSLTSQRTNEWRKCATSLQNDNSSFDLFRSSIQKWVTQAEEAVVRLGEQQCTQATSGRPTHNKHRTRFTSARLGGVIHISRKLITWCITCDDLRSTEADYVEQIDMAELSFEKKLYDTLNLCHCTDWTERSLEIIQLKHVTRSKVRQL